MVGPGTGQRAQNENVSQRDETMKLFKLAKTFRNDESGAVTVDWVVLTEGMSVV